MRAVVADWRVARSQVAVMEGRRERSERGRRERMAVGGWYCWL